MASVSIISSGSRDLPTTDGAMGTEVLNSSSASRFKNAGNLGFDVAEEELKEFVDSSDSRSRNDLEAVGFFTPGLGEIGCFPFAVDS